MRLAERQASLDVVVQVVQSKLIPALHREGERVHAEALEMFIAYCDDKFFRVAVFGEFSTGKSRLINALLGRRVLPAKARPTTGQVTQLFHSGEEVVTVSFKDGSKQGCSLKDIDDFVLLDVHSRTRDDVERIEMMVDAPSLGHGMTLIDTPGLADSPTQTERAKRAVGSSDLVLFVLDARQLLSMEERSLALDWLARDLGKPVVPIQFHESGGTS